MDAQPRRLHVAAAGARASVIAAVLLVLAGLWTLHEFLPALIWALVLAIGVWPVFDRAARRFPKHRKGLLPAAVVGAVLLVFVVPLTLVAVPLARATLTGWPPGCSRRASRASPPRRCWAGCPTARGSPASGSRTSATPGRSPRSLRAPCRAA